MQQAEMQLTSCLRSLGSYKYQSELKNQVMQFLNNFSGFTININQVQRQNGQVVGLISMDGMIQTLFQGVNYNTLIKIVLDSCFPVEGGIHIFVITNLEKSHFRPIKNLDIANNYYNVEGIPGYTRQLPLYEVIRMVSVEFSKDPPVSSGGRGQTTPRLYTIPGRIVPTAPSGPSSTYGSQLYSSMYSQPMPPQPNPYEMGYGMGPSQISPPTIGQEYYQAGGYQMGMQQPRGESIAELRARLLLVLSAGYERKATDLSTELDSKKLRLKALEEDCERKKNSHVEARNRVESVVVEKAQLERKLASLDTEIKTLENEDEPDPDTLCDPVTEWEKQLLCCIATDNAYEDLIFYLNKAFEKKKLDQEQFLVSIREEAKHQFEQKALGMKIRSEMKKIGYKPPF